MKNDEKSETKESHSNKNFLKENESDLPIFGQHYSYKGSSNHESSDNGSVGFGMGKLRNMKAGSTKDVAKSENKLNTSGLGGEQSGMRGGAINDEYKHIYGSFGSFGSIKSSSKKSQTSHHNNFLENLAGPVSKINEKVEHLMMKSTKSANMKQKRDPKIGRSYSEINEQAKQSKSTKILTKNLQLKRSKGAKDPRQGSVKSTEHRQRSLIKTFVS